MVPDKSPLEKRNDLRSFLMKNKNSIQESLPKFLSAERLIGQLFTTIAMNPDLLDCTPRSLIGSLLYCGSLGLEPGPLGHIYLIPFRNNDRGTREVQIIPGYKGLVQLVRRSEMVSNIGMDIVWDGDEFDCEIGTNAFIHHKPNPKRENFSNFEEVLWAYAYYWPKGAERPEVKVMSRSQVEWHRNRYSKAAQKGPWVTAWPEMAKKTALRANLKLAPMMVEVHSAIAMDEFAENQLSQESLLGESIPENLSEELDKTASREPEPQVTRVPQWAANNIKGKALPELSVPQLRGLASTLKKRTDVSVEKNPHVEAEKALLAEVQALIESRKEDKGPIVKPKPEEKPKPETAKPAEPTVPKEEKPIDHPDRNLRRAEALRDELMKMPGGHFEYLDIIETYHVGKITDLDPSLLPEFVEKLMGTIQRINKEVQQAEQEG